VGERRLPDVIPARAAVMRPSGRASRSALGLIAVALIGSSCIAPGPGPSRPREPGTPSPSPLAATSEPGSAQPSSPPGGTSPSPLSELIPISAKLGSFTIICADWGAEPPTEAIDCSHAATLGLAAIGDARAAVVRRLDIGFGDPCGTAASCPARRADIRWVIARSGDFDTLLVRIVRRADGGYDVFPPVEGRAMPPPAFDPPALAAPDLGRDAPIELRTRPRLAFCGEEVISRPDEFDAKARRCFVDGIEAWTPVELITRDISVDGGPVTSVERYVGRGGIQHYVLSGGWSASDCALSPISTIAAFVVTSPCEPRVVHP
jgi:hypothetical protein